MCDAAKGEGGYLCWDQHSLNLSGEAPAGDAGSGDAPTPLPRTDKTLFLQGKWNEVLYFDHHWRAGSFRACPGEREKMSTFAETAPLRLVRA